MLEWGCGHSSLWWAARARTVDSVEHDPAWFDQVARRLPANARVVLATDPTEYASAAHVKGGGPYDAVLIDGEFRDDCARTAVTVVKPGGLIILDNSDRPSLRGCLEFLAGTGWFRVDFFGLLPGYGYRICTSIGFRDPAVLSTGPFPCDARSRLGPSLSQVMSE